MKAQVQCLDGKNSTGGPVCQGRYRAREQLARHLPSLSLSTSKL